MVAKSWTGYILTLAGCPLIWVSKLQTKVSMSTMIAKSAALPTSMRDMLHLQQLVKTVAKVVTGKDDVQVECHSDVFEDNNGAFMVAITLQIMPQSKFFAVKLHFFKFHDHTTENPQCEVHIQKIQIHLQMTVIMTKGFVKDKFISISKTGLLDGTWTKLLLQKLTFMTMVQMSIQGALWRINWSLLVQPISTVTELYLIQYSFTLY